MSEESGQYEGLNKSELLTILSDVKGDKNQIPDTDAFQQAWQEAETIIVHSEAAFEVPHPHEQWSLIPLSQIEEDNLDGLTQSLFDLNKRYGVSYPADIDSMQADDIRSYLKEVVCRPELREHHKKVLREDELKSRIGNPQNRNPGPFCRVNLNGRTLFNYAAISEYLHHEYHTITFHPPGLPHKIFIYDENTGIYRQNSGDLESVINRIFEISDATGSVTRDTKEILHLISSKSRHTTYPFNQQKDTSIGLIPVLNGVVQIDFNAGRVSLTPHSHEHRWTFTIPVSYNPDASPDTIVEIMKSWIGEWEEEEELEEEQENKIIKPDKWKILLQVPAQGLLQFIMDKVYKTSYVIVGEPNGGKSSYITHFLPRFLGSDAVAGESLHKVVSDKFVTGNLENKILNAFDDLSDTELGAVGQFKAITGTTRHTINRKHQGEYTGRIFCCHAFACNQLPKVPDSCMYDTAFWDRWMIIRFPFIFDKDPTFQNSLISDTNLSAFLTLTIGMMISIRQSHSLPFEQSPGEVMEQWNQKADPLAQFIDEMLEESSKQYEFDREKLHDAYCLWFDDQEPKIDTRKKIQELKDFSNALIKYELLSTRTSKKKEKKKFNLTVFKGKYSWVLGQDKMEPRIKGLEEWLKKKSEVE